MDTPEKSFRKDYIGNIRFEFFTNRGSLTIEAWCSTRNCRVSTFNKGVGRRTEVKLTDDQWWKLVIPVAYSGFQKWEKRYDSHVSTGYAPSWSVSIMTKFDWYYSSGDGAFPDGFQKMLKGLVEFASEIENTESAKVGGFLQSYLPATEA
ncbi:MAG: hypothetical protein MJZ21_02350 [archaeon]|nr:hypothetical protein [archaeon]